MVNGVHAMVFATDAAAARAFFRDVLGFPYVDDGDGWLIFRLPPGELGVHDTEGQPPSGHHQIYLTCDDVAATVADLRGKGVEVGEVTDQGWGLLAEVTVPGAGPVGLYEPKHRRPPEVTA